ncbi:tyrosine--tRNA ligase [Candidatus Peregrinibacteria bacterium]|nr:tyrosine--tRNA ligase [Candidatus Peregrinibacteria bacterium]
MPSDTEISELLDRGIAEVPTRESFEKKLRSGKKLRIYLGIDPTGSDLTLGHAVALRKLQQFQKYGHHVILLFGTFTAKIGDPTGKSETRKPLTDAEITKNMETYLEQAGKVLDISKVEIVKNGDWLSKMTFEDVLKLAGTFTVSQMLHREMYQDRIKNNQEINLVEFMYPLMQGYDPIPMKADAEIGGTDQLFNLMAGRKIMEAYGIPPQEVLTVPILEGLDGIEKMSKSLGNYIAIMDSPREMFGKTMSIPDHLILRYFELATTVSLDEIEALKKELKKGMNPRDAKVRLAKEIVTLFHDASAADHAEEEFNRMFQEKGLPDEIPEISMKKGKYTLLDLVLKTSLFSSNSDARRMIEQGGVKINGEKKIALDDEIQLDTEIILQAGKRKFCKIIVAKS